MMKNAIKSLEVDDKSIVKKFDQLVSDLDLGETSHIREEEKINQPTVDFIETADVIRISEEEIPQ